MKKKKEGKEKEKKISTSIEIFEGIEVVIKDSYKDLFEFNKKPLDDTSIQVLIKKELFRAEIGINKKNDSFVIRILPKDSNQHSKLLSYKLEEYVPFYKLEEKRYDSYIEISEEVIQKIKDLKTMVSDLSKVKREKDKTKMNKLFTKNAVDVNVTYDMCKAPFLIAKDDILLNSGIYEDIIEMIYKGKLKVESFVKAAYSRSLGKALFQSDLKIKKEDFLSIYEEAKQEK